MVVSVLFPTHLRAATTAMDTWPSSVHSHLSTLRNQPKQVISAIDQQLASETRPQHKAAYYALLSRAYSALMLPATAAEHADTGLSLVTRKDHPWLFHNLAVAKAEALDDKGEPGKGKSLTLAAINWARDNASMDLLSYAMSVDGRLSLTLSATDDALATFQRGYTLVQSHDTLLQPGDFASLIALVYEYRNEPDLALPYYQEAYEYYLAHDIKLELANTIFGLGKANLNLGHRDKGMAQLRQSAELALEISDRQGAAYSYQVIAGQLIEEGNLAKAESYLDDALAIFSDANNRFMQINVLLSLNEIAAKQTRYTYSLTLLDQAQSLASGDAFLPSKIAINERKSQLFASLEEFEKAYQLMLINTALKSRLNRQQNSERLLELKTRFEVEQQQAQNALLKEQNLRQQTMLSSEQKLQRYSYAVVVLLLVICLLFGFMYINSRRHQEHLEKLANEDELTGLITRRHALAQFEHHLSLTRRHGTPLAVALLDLDFFKQINDSFGHQTGDAVLREFGKLALRSFRSTDLLCRIGGEEFLFLFPHTEVSKAQLLLQRFAVAVRDIPHTIGKPELSVSVSVGVTAHVSTESESTMLAQADKALYQAKAEGRDKIVSLL